MNREKLESLFKEHVCNKSCPITLSLIRESEIKRLIVIHLYNELCYKKRENQICGTIIQKTGFPQKSVTRWVSHYKAEKERKNLQELFLKYACSHICLDALDYMRISEIRKIVVIGLYEHFTIKKEMQEKESRKEIKVLTGIGRHRVYSIVKKYQNDNSIFQSQ